MRSLRESVYTFLAQRMSTRGLVEAKKRSLLLRNGKKFFVASFPKSGSTFLCKTMAELTGASYTFYFDEVGHVSEQNLSEVRMSDNIRNDVVVHQHLLGSNENIHHLLSYSIRPVVLVRNIFDCILSLRDHMYHEGLEWPFLFSVDKSFYNYSRKKQIDFLIRFAAPWYLNFYVSWISASKNGKLDILIINYHDLIKDKALVIGKVMEFYTEYFSTEEIEATIKMVEETKEIRFNRANKDSRRYSFDDEQKSELMNMALFYKDIDFSMIGL